MNSGLVVALVAALCVQGVLCAPASAEEGTIVLLKFDDLSGKAKSHVKVAEWAQKEGIKINFGVFGKSLENPSPEYVQWMKEMVKSGNFELWNHGYGGFGNADKTEGVPYEEQRDRIGRTQALSKKHLGEPFVAYGPHAAAMNGDTWKAFLDFPEIKAVFGRPPEDWTGKAFVIRNRVGLEGMPDLKPSKQRLINSWEKVGKGKPYIFVQGHPNAWKTDQDWEEVKGAIQFLREQGCRFMTISEFLKTLDPADAAKPDKPVNQVNQEKQDKPAEPAKDAANTTQP